MSRSEHASWHPALRPNSDKEEAVSRDTVGDVATDSLISAVQQEHDNSETPKSQPRHFAQSASIHHLPDQEDSESSLVHTEEAFDDLPKQGIDYTNSFPAASTHPTPIEGFEELPEPLPQSQVENLIVGQDAAEGASGEPSTLEAKAEDLWGDEQDDFFGGSAGHDETVTVEEDSRFSEGLPLVQNEEKPAEAPQSELDWGDAEAEDDFFGGASQPEPGPGTLDRKSTSDVLDTMHYPPHSENHNDPEPPEEENTENLVNGAVAVSAATVVAQASSEAERTGQPTTDLAAIWSEALDDDLLMDDNDAAVDPSSFFEDDGEGFLDDSMISPPAPVPVVDQAGQIKGFSSVGGPQRYAPNQTSASYMPNGYQTSLPNVNSANMSFGVQPRPEPSKAQSFVDKAKGGYESPYDLPMDLRPKRQSAQRQSSAPKPSTGPVPVPPPKPGNAGPPMPFSSGQQGPPAPPLKQAAAKPSGFFEELPMAPKPPRPGSTARFSHAPQLQAAANLTGPPMSNNPAPPPPSNAPQSPPVASGEYGLVMPRRQLSFGEDQGQQSAPTQQPPKASNRYSPSPASQSSLPGQPPVQGRYSSAPAATPPSGPFQRAPSVGFAAPFQPRTSSPLARSTSISDESNALRKSSTSATVANGIQRGFTSPEMSPTYQGMMHSPEKIQSIPNTASQPSTAQQTGTVRHKRRAPSIIKQYIPPADNRAEDPLERWKGGPIFKFGSGGIVTSFPVETPRFSVGQTQPLYMVNPGEVKVRGARLIMPADDSITAFPGPLKAKGKKKEVLAWLAKRVETLKVQEIETSASQNPIVAQSRRDERVLLFQILTILVEHDGNLESPAAASAIRDALVPPAAPVNAQLGGADYGTGFAQGISRSATLQPKTHTTDVSDVEEVRKLLLQGDREKAAWLAVDKNLWGHAMLISSTIQGDVWKQVIHEFVRNEVKPCGNNAEALSALYDVFSGNWEESIDQLVPQAARSGFQMVSKSGSTPEQDALAGLDRWQETLALIVSNRTAGDVKAIVSLGELLAGYGRAEAAHVCYIVAKLPGLLSGSDDPQAHAVLLGANHRQRPFDFHKDIEAILATEVYEFGINVLAGGTAAVPLPHLAPYKLQHAYVLAEAGHRDEAQQYCEAITASLKSKKMVPYLHAQFVANLDDLVNRLSQAPRESKSWLANPKMGNVSSSLLSSFSKFVAGDDSDNASTGSGPTGEPGPFGTISGEPISLSRSASPSMYGPGHFADNTATAPMPIPTGNSRYAPTGSSPSGSYTAMQHRDSAGSLPSMSPDHFRRSVTSAYQPQGAYTPTSGLAHAESYTSEIPRSVPAIVAPAGATHDSHAIDSRPSTSDGPVGLGRMSGRRTSYEPLSATSAQRDRDSSSYQPRVATYESKSSSPYAPRSGSYASRSYAPSPVASDRLQPQTQAEPASYTPQAPVEQTPVEPPESAGQSPTAVQGEPAQLDDSAKPGSEAPINFGYDPSPAYGYQPAVTSGTEEVSTQEAPQTGYGYQPPEPSAPETKASEADDSGSYAPPSFSYEPPSYQPYEPDNDAEADSPVKSKKKGIMDLDDEDGFSAKSGQLKNDEKARKDREAEDAFRRAAEADAARDSKPAAGQKKGWFGGWLSGKKDEGLGSGSGGSAEPTVHRAKLGEESSFVYDAALKKWVNKKAGADNTPAKSATPPPPRAGPPSRSASAMGPPPTSVPTSLPGSSSVPGSRNVSPLVNMKGQSEGEAPAGTPPMKAAGGPPLPSGLAPPSRPGTASSTVSSATGDDLLASMGPRKGAAGKKAKKGGRYVDVMAK